MEGGPDFRAAVIQFGSEPPRSGDVEIDLRAGGWKDHGHDRNPAFNSVILHVVWTAPARECSGPPLLPIEGALDTTLAELAECLGSSNVPELPDEFRGRCAAPLRELNETALDELLREAALVRLHSKASQFAARARHGGWEQSLWEGLFSALGYKHNTWPMQRLAELRPRWAESATDTAILQARLLGIANLLPADLTRSRPESDSYLRGLWDAWWRERDGFEDCLLPRSLWRLHGIRPVNHPQRRLALAAHWVGNHKLMCKLEKWFLDEAAAPDKASANRLATSLNAVLQPGQDAFWSRHLTLRSARTPKPQLLLGAARVTDLAVNVILPWLWARAQKGRTSTLRSQLETAYLTWPAGEDNATLKLARQRLLGMSSLKPFRTAATQQGLLQILRDYCRNSNSICDACQFPELVRAFAAR